MIDLSFQGAQLVIGLVGSKANIVLDFSDEGTPVEFPDLEVCGYAMTLNGELVTWTKPTPVQFNVTVIPGSKSDQALRSILYAGHIGGKRGRAINQKSVIIPAATLSVPSVYTVTGSAVSNAGSMRFTLANGRLTAGTPGIGSNAEGKMSARTYRFVFESISTNA